MVENLKKQIEILEADIAKLEENIRIKNAEKSTASAQIQARIFLENIFAPYMDGLCDIWGLSPEEGLRVLIKENASLDKIAKDNPKALAEFLSQPEIKVIAAVARPLGSMSDEWIEQKMSVLLEVMVKIRPSMANAIIETPEGMAWFYESLIGLRNMLFGVLKLSHVDLMGKPQINIETT